MAGTSLDVRTSMAELDGLLVVSLPSEVSDAVLQRIVRDVSQRATEPGIDGVILNLSAVALLDLSEFEVMRHLVLTNAVLGVRTVLVGIRPGIAAYLCEMPISTRGLIFRLDMAGALDVCRPAGHATA
jgi:rsbT antagonist protein RsbS